MPNEVEYKTNLHPLYLKNDE